MPSTVWQLLIPLSFQTWWQVWFSEAVWFTRGVFCGSLSHPNSSSSQRCLWNGASSSTSWLRSRGRPAWTLLSRNLSLSNCRYADLRGQPQGVCLHSGAPLLCNLACMQRKGWYGLWVLGTRHHAVKSVQILCLLGVRSYTRCNYYSQYFVQDEMSLFGYIICCRYFHEICMLNTVSHHFFFIFPLTYRTVWLSLVLEQSQILSHGLLEKSLDHQGIYYSWA